MQTIPRRTAALAAATAAGVMICQLAIPEPADARGARARAAASMHRSGQVSRPAPRPTRDIPANRDVNRQDLARDVNRDYVGDGGRERDGEVDRDINRDVDRSFDQDIDIDRDIDIDEDIDIDVDDGWDDDWGDHPVAAGMAFGTAAAVTSAAIGSWAYTLPPSCVASPYYGYSYYHCGDVWYEPQYSGTQVTYVVVEEPTDAGGSSDDPNCTYPDPDDPRCDPDGSSEQP